MEKFGKFLLEVGCADAISPSLAQTEWLRVRRPLCWCASTNIISSTAVPLWESVAVKTPRTLRMRGVLVLLPGPQRDKNFCAGLSFFDFTMLSPTTVTDAPVSSLKLAVAHCSIGSGATATM